MTDEKETEDEFDQRILKDSINQPANIPFEVEDKSEEQLKRWEENE
jgi:hypothetical protein